VFRVLRSITEGLNGHSHPVGVEVPRSSGDATKMLVRRGPCPPTEQSNRGDVAEERRA
jgi:hypothetical protein